MIAGGAFTKVERVGQTGRVYVDRRFAEFAFDKKSSIMAGLYVYFFPTIDPAQKIRLIDAYTNKSIGVYSPSAGLHLD